ncbi:MAG: hypothetical protein AMXMBFR53_30190 [Gemmatimonadota bacterium]
MSDDAERVVEAISNAIYPVAMMQTTLCEIEKRMGIYPNVPRLLADHGGDHE